MLLYKNSELLARLRVITPFCHKSCGKFCTHWIGMGFWCGGNNVYFSLLQSHKCNLCKKPVSSQLNQFTDIITIKNWSEWVRAASWLGNKWNKKTKVRNWCIGSGCGWESLMEFLWRMIILFSSALLFSVAGDDVQFFESAVYTLFHSQIICLLFNFFFHLNLTFEWDEERNPILFLSNHII